MAIVAAITISIHALSIKDDIPDTQNVEQLISLVKATLAGTLVLVVILVGGEILIRRAKKIQKDDERRTRTPTSIKKDNNTRRT